jgi:organic hydroperoxide reductase OsmC/OhrA
MSTEALQQLVEEAHAVCRCSMAAMGNICVDPTAAEIWSLIRKS